MIKFKNNTYYKLSGNFYSQYIIRIYEETWKVKFLRNTTFDDGGVRWLKRGETDYSPVSELRDIINLYEYKVEELNDGDMVLELL